MIEKNTIETNEQSTPDQTANNIKNSIGSKKRGPSNKEEKNKKTMAAEQINKLFNSEICSDLAAIPFDVAVIASGSEIFRLSDKEKKTLGIPLEITIKAFELTKDPKYFALGILLMQYSKLLGVKYLQWKLSEDQKKKDSQKKTGIES